MLNENWKDLKVGDMVTFAGQTAQKLLHDKIVTQEDLELALEYIQFSFIRYKLPVNVPDGEMMIYLTLNKEFYQREIESYEIRSALSE
jgi:hypothetical protein